MITTDTNKVIYVSDGTTTEYDFSFTVYDKSHLSVYIKSPNSNKSVKLTEDNYTITLNENYNGGKVVLNNPLPQYTKISIIREVPEVQELHYIEGSPFPAQSHERALDKLTMITQQLDEKISRVPMADTFTDNIDFNDLYNSIQYCSENVEALAKSISMTVNTIQDLIKLDTSILTDKTGVLVLGYHEPNDGGGGIFYWDAEQDKGNHNGGTVIDPMILYPTDWTDQSQLTTWFTASNTGNGCWVKQHDGVVNVKWFGAKGDGVTYDTEAIQKACTLYSHIYFEQGEYVITNTIKVNKTGFRMEGSSEGTVRIIPSTSFTGDMDSDNNLIMFYLGDGVTSKYFNEISNIEFVDSNNIGNICGLYFNRVNSTSKIFNCSFRDLAKGFEFINLSLANIISFNKFMGCIDNFRLTSTAGNSTIISHNYFNGGRIYLNDSMTDVKIIDNVADSSFYIYTDGLSGNRGCTISRNRFESNVSPILQIGTTRGLSIYDNFFQGNNVVDTAIKLDSSSSIQSCFIYNNKFENILTTLIDSSFNSNKYYIYNNEDMSDTPATNPFVNVSNSTIKTLGIKSDSSVLTLHNTPTIVNKNGDEITQEVNIYKKYPGLDSSDVDIFKITTNGTQGSFTCIIEWHFGQDLTSTAVSVATKGDTFIAMNSSDDTLYLSDIQEYRPFINLANDSSIREVTSVTTLLTKIDNNNINIGLSADLTGGDLYVVKAKVTIIQSKYTEPLKVSLL